MNRWGVGLIAVAGLISSTVSGAFAQDFYSYGVPRTYGSSVYVPGGYQSTVITSPSTVVTAGYAPAYAYAPPVIVQQQIVPMAYAAPVVARPVYAAPVYAAPVYAAPVYAAPVGGAVVREWGGPRNYTQVVRSYGPYGPHYNRVHVHSGFYGTTVRERSW